MGLEPDDTEHHDPSKDRGKRVSETDYNGVLESIVARLVVAGQSYEGAGGYAEGEENLGGSLQPDLRGEELLSLKEETGRDIGSRESEGGGGREEGREEGREGEGGRERGGEEGRGGRKVAVKGVESMISKENETEEENASKEVK